MDSSHCFDNQFAYGKVGESKVAQYFKSRGYAVLPIYEKEIAEGKGPAIYFPDVEVIGTDMMVFKKDRIYWIEAKHKTAFSWHRKTSRFVTGIDIKHYNHYLEIAKRTSWPVWLLFYHDGGQAKDSPASPMGLFGNELFYLSKNENHRHDNWGKYGMVYWAIDILKRLDGGCDHENLLGNSRDGRTAGAFQSDREGGGGRGSPGHHRQRNVL